MARIKEDFIRDVMTQCSMDRNTAGKMVEAILKHVKASLAGGETVLISGFGEFKVKHKRARMGRNPKTNEEHEISERDVVVFHPSKVFRREINP